MTLTYTADQRDRLEKLVELEYDHTIYTVGDAEDVGERNQPSNREVFSVISYLYNLVGINPQNLPVQQFIQVP
jgi:hypothetical protein